MPMQIESLQRRFERLGAVVTAWEIRYNSLPDQVVSRFEASDLQAIARLLTEKRRLERLIPDLKEFLQKWEEDADRMAYSTTGSEFLDGDED